MIIQSFPHQNSIYQIGHKLASMINYKEKVAKVLVSTLLTNRKQDKNYYFQ
ncbi:DUF4322 domain-containing protein [Saccharolobus solfataricus]|uniref:DUF4322 domain-containing protein n=2 Tax=Saccharolobus solfataricus TaxID=2287 RepID=A0A3G8DDK7_SACSO|nr:DUF4322 domain-containing protein [Saccharolobus solfataricus]AYN75744.1 DUF4322 domain-containing protein [Saccharolobus solfataricus]AYP18579.1 DUF4322 domain-containing protein [Saccharolobus solfataricus]AZF67602.1 DUF4322 domain-containing protein [Saccharolobus solfataricus]AZF70222.1 DUF4322 domain-containing protein [Saccharolobus solfataricus]